MPQPNPPQPVRNSSQSNSEPGKLRAQREEAASMSEAQTPVEPMPPASRLGEILGWSLLTLAAACFTASIVAIVQAHAASQAVQHAEDAWHNAIIVAHRDHTMAYAAPYEATYMAAKVTYNETTLRMSLSLDASIVFLLLIPGLLYAVKPSLFGGPLGRLLRASSARLAPRQPQRRHPVTFYQGIGLMLNSLPWISFSLLPTVVTLTTMPFELVLGLSLLPVLLFMISLVVGNSLVGEATWWLGANREQERPQA